MARLSDQLRKMRAQKAEVREEAIVFGPPEALTFTRDRGCVPAADVDQHVLDFWQSADPHGIVSVTNIGDGWDITCTCDWQSGPCETMQDAGRMFDEHLEGKCPS